MFFDDRKLEFVRYESLERCMAAYHGVSGEEDLPDGRWEFYTSDGKFHVWSAARAVRSIKRKGRWGWCENKERVHFWVDARRAGMPEVVRMLAHEIGHTEKPWHRSLEQEEMKANDYGRVAELAVKVYQDFFTRENAR